MEHKDICDTERGTNETTRDPETDDVASLKAESDELTASIGEQANKIASPGVADATLAA